MLWLVGVVLRHWRVSLVALGLGVVAILVVRERNRMVENAQKEVLLQIDEANRQSKEKADHGASKVDDCYAGGGTWNRSRGVCDRATAND